MLKTWPPEGGLYPLFFASPGAMAETCGQLDVSEALGFAEILMGEQVW